MELSERIRNCMTTSWAEQGITGPKDKYTLQLIEEQLWVADEVAQLEDALREADKLFISLGQVGHIIDKVLDVMEKGRLICITALEKKR